MKSEVYKIKMDSRDELFARIKTREDDVRRTTRDLRTRFAKCNEVEGGILERVIVKCNKIRF
jgi:hypothetical protein